MRASDFIGTPALDPQGRRCGVVIDVRTRWAQGSGLLVAGIVVATRHWRLFGYERRRQHGPALLWWLIRRIHRHTRYATVDEFDRDNEAGVIRLREQYTDLPRLMANR